MADDSAPKRRRNHAGETTTAGGEALPRTRRTQQERTAETRRKLIEAAIAILAESGYAATSTTVVADRAGVSRGSIFYNFPTKADLMLAVLDHVLREDMRFYARRLAGITSRRAYVLEQTKVSWEAFSGPRGIAVMQIMLGGASDPELKTRLPKSLLRISEESADSQQRRAPAGEASRKLRTVVSRVHVAALRGMAMELIAGGRPEDLAEELALLGRYMEFVLDVLAPEAAAKDKAAAQAEASGDDPL